MIILSHQKKLMFCSKCFGRQGRYPNDKPTCWERAPPAPMWERDKSQPSGLSFLTQAGKRRNKHCLVPNMRLWNLSPVKYQKGKNFKRNTSVRGRRRTRRRERRRKVGDPQGYSSKIGKGKIRFCFTLSYSFCIVPSHRQGSRILKMTAYSRCTGIKW